VPNAADEPLTLAFVGYADPVMSERATAYEDEVLPLIEDHGGRVLYRGRRADGQDTALPLEVHLLWFPHRRALDAYLADDRRRDLIDRYGDVFTTKHAVEVDTISTATPPAPAAPS
jgi:uncharacterized protein (DUF1330 family)